MQKENGTIKLVSLVQKNNIAERQCDLSINDDDDFIIEWMDLQRGK